MNIMRCRCLYKYFLCLVSRGHVARTAQPPSYGGRIYGIYRQSISREGLGSSWEELSVDSTLRRRSIIETFTMTGSYGLLH